MRLNSVLCSIRVLASTIAAWLGSASLTVTVTAKDYSEGLLLCVDCQCPMKASMNLCAHLDSSSDSEKPVLQQRLWRIDGLCLAVHPDSKSM